MKVLIVESNETSRKSLYESLDGWGYQVSAVDDPAAVMGSIQRESPPSMVLVGTLADSTPVKQLCRSIREFGEKPYIYVLLLAEKGKSEEILEFLEAGADDYVTRPFDELELKARLRAGKRILDLRDELRRAQATIGYQAYHDPLTGLWNRGAIIDALQRELARVRREKAPVGLLMVSIDGLKDINDKYGHMAGDAAIRATARELRSSLRPYDAIGRYGGEAFVIIVTGCDSRSSMKQAERFFGVLKGRTVDISQWGKFVSGKDSALPILYSIGVISGTGEHDSETLLKSLEGALRQARTAGGNRIESVTPPPPMPRKK
jgi:two-component system cell cycle response regulator